MSAHAWKYQVDETKKRKHHWKHARAGFVAEGGEIVGKCPSDLSLARAEQLLNSHGIAWSNPRLPQGSWPDCIYVVHDGVVYRAVPTVAGVSYHAFPELPERLRRLPRSLRAQILGLAERLGCMKEVQEWMDR